jgi:rare lipoprotein A
MYDMTAAHKTLPLGTWVEVTHLDSRRKVVVRVNDRGPFVRGRIIDLSYAAAKNLGVVGPGTMRVRVTALGTAQRRRVAGREEDVLVAKPSYQEGRFAVQVGAFADPARAKELAKRMESEFGSATIQRFDHPERVLYRVHVADVGSLDKAQEIQDRLEQLGFDDCFVVAR